MVFYLLAIKRISEFKMLMSLSSFEDQRILLQISNQNYARGWANIIFAGRGNKFLMIFLTLGSA